MNIRTIKKISQQKEFTYNLIQKIKKILKLENTTIVGYLGKSIGEFQYFIQQEKLYVTNLKHESNEFDFDYLAEIELAKNDIKINEILNEQNIVLEFEIVANWLNSPNWIVENIDDNNIDVIKLYIQKQNKPFKIGHYEFYTKYNDESYFGNVIYGKNLKNNKEAKLYINFCFEDKHIPPQKLSDIAIFDLDNQLNSNQKVNFKKAFLEFCKNEKEYYCLDMLDKINRSIITCCGIGVHRIFAGSDKFKFTNIWIDDFVSKNDEPYFFLTDNSLFWKTTKIAMFNIKTPKYKTKGLYKQGEIKYKFWNLKKEYVEKLIEFFNKPYEKEIIIDKKVKNNWQKLIVEYNYNTAEPLGLKKLPLNLEIPNYMEIFND